MNISLENFQEKKEQNTLSNKARWHSIKKWNDKKKEAFYRELAILLQSGVDFKKALEILCNQTKILSEQETINNLKSQVVSGKAFWEAMKSSNQFSAYEYYSIQIGEETRKLEEVLSELQKYFARKIQMKRQLISVLTYPVIVLIITMGVLYFMLNKVVPMFSSVFKQFDSELPKSTQIIIKISSNSSLIFSVLLVLIITIVGSNYYLKNKNWYRDYLSKAIIRTPFFGNLITKIYLSRFCQSMSLLTASKTSLIASLNLTARMIRFYPIEKSLFQIKQDIEKGVSFSESLKKHDIYERKLVSMVEVAEQVNQLDTMFNRLTEQYNEEVNHQTKMIGVILEPLIIIIIGVIVGVIMIAMYAPMFDLSKIIRS